MARAARSRSPLALFALTAISLVGPSSAAGAQGAEALGDFVPGYSTQFTSTPGGFTPLGSSVVFSAYDAMHGSELWSWDGETARLFGDLAPGPASSSPGSFVHAGRAVLYFRAYDAALGGELWRVDSKGRAQPLFDLCPGSCGGASAPLFHSSLGLLFRGASTEGDWEPWITDGTIAGTQRLVDVREGGLSSYPRDFTENAGTVFFTATSETDRELWATDGTPAAPGSTGTRRLFASCHACGPLIANLTVWQGLLYFTAGGADGEAKLWVTDGTVAGTRLVSDPGVGVSVGEIAPFDGFLYLITDGTPSAWRTNGVGNGAVAGELFPGGANHRINSLLPVGSRLFALVDPPELSPGRELWVLDAAGTPARPLANRFDWGPFFATPFGDRLVFEAGTPASGREPWVSDGTAAGTRLLADLRPGGEGSLPGGFTAVGDRVYFSARDDAGREPWVSDGTTAGTRRIADINRPPFAGFERDQPARLGDRIYFLQKDGGPVLWSTDGTTAGTAPVMEWEILTWLRTDGQRLYLQGRPPGGVYGLYGSDGTALGTELLLGGSVSRPVPALGEVYFSTLSPGQQLWASDGTPAGTRQIFDIHPGYVGPCPPILCAPVSDLPSGLSASAGTLYFNAFAEGQPRQLWKSDGLTGGTLPVREFPGSEYGPQSITPHGDGVLFLIAEGTSEPELWFSDGTHDGTRPLSELLSTPIPRSPRALTTFGDATVLVGRRLDGGDELWRIGSDPFVADRISDLVARGRISQAGAPFAAGDRFYVPVYHPASGRELWISDGTAEGTGLLIDLAPAHVGSYPQPLAFAGERLFFAADDGRSGLELWSTDGTAEGTALVEDVAPGAAASSPDPVAVVGSRLVFFAEDGATGREPWVVELGAEFED